MISSILIVLRLIEQLLRWCSVIDNWNQESIESFHAVLICDCSKSIFKIPSSSWRTVNELHIAGWEKKSSSSVLAQALNQFEFTQPRDGKYFEVKCLSLESGLWLHSRFLEWVRACESSAWFDTKNEGKLKKYFDLTENRLYVKSIKRKLLKSVAKNQDKTQTVCEKQNKVVNDWTHSRAARSKSLVTRCM